MDENQQIKMSPDWAGAEETGNANTDARRSQAGRALSRVAVSALRTESLDVVPEDVKIRFATYGGGEHLAIVRGTDREGRPVVAFHSGESVIGLMIGVQVKLDAGELNWKPDKFRQ